VAVDPSVSSPRAAPPADGLWVRLLGDVAVSLPDGTAMAVDSARARALVTYLVLHRDAPQPRQKLAFLLWPDSSESQSRTNLRHLLHTLRRSAPAIASLLEVTPGAIAWRPDRPCRVDVIEFEAALDEADADGTAPARALGRRQEAIDLYRGDLLADAYDDWVLAERDRLRQRLLTALQRVAAHWAAVGAVDDANHAARALWRCDPLREDTYRFLIELSTSAGDRAGAVRWFHECTATLQRELGVEPGPATREAFAAATRADDDAHATAVDGADVTDQTDSAAAGARDDVRAPRVTGPALVGRDAERDQLRRCWDDALAGRRQLVLVTGEPGIGKTRLVEDVVAWAARRGAVIASSRSYPTEGELGYGAAVAWLRSAGLAAPDRPLPPGDVAVLAPLLPELGPAGAAPAPQDALDEAAQRQRIFDAVTRAVSARGPVLLVADDAHWCDEPSLQLLHYLLRAVGGPFLAVATARREELDGSAALARLVHGLVVLDGVTEIALERLTPAATAELVGELAVPATGTRRATGTGAGAGPASEAPVDRIVAETEGNPLFIVEVMRALADGGPPDGTLLTPKLQAVISLRLQQLSAPAIELLGLAATAGRDVSTPILARSCGLDETSLVRGLDELWRRGILREQGIDAYDFSHGKLRDVAYDAMSPATRRRNHRLIAETLREAHGAAVDERSGEIAFHYDRAGQPGPAVEWYLRAAGQAQARHATVDALRLLWRARDLTAADAVGAEPRRVVLAALCTPLSVVEGFASVRLAEVQDEAMALADEAGGVDGGGGPEPSLLRSIAMTRLCRRDFEGAQEVASALLASAARAGDAVLDIESRYLLGIADFWAGEMDAAAARFEEVLGRFDPGRRAEHLQRFGHDPEVVCASRRANVLWFLDRTDDARAARDGAVALATEVGHPFSLGVTLVFAGLLAVDLDERQAVRGYAGALAAVPRTAAFAAASEAFGGYVDVLDGRPGPGLARVRAVVDASAPDHAPGQVTTHARLLVAAYDAAGDAAGGLAAVDEALRMGGSRIWEAELRRLRAVFLAGQDAPAGQVDAELDRARAVAAASRLPGLTRRVNETAARLRP